MPAIDRITAAATGHGWRIIAPDDPWERYRYERRNGREIEQVTVVYDVRGAVNTASQQRNRRGDDARVVHPTEKAKADTVIAWLTTPTRQGDPAMPATGKPPITVRAVRCYEKAVDDGGLCTGCGRYIHTERLHTKAGHLPNIDGSLGYIHTYADGTTRHIPPQPR